MDSDHEELELVNTALDYTKLSALNQRRQTENLNHFLLNTVHFFNTFSSQLEEKFQKLETNLQRIEADFSILDSKLRSTPGYQPLDLIEVNVPAVTENVQQAVVPTTANIPAAPPLPPAGASNSTSPVAPPPPPPPEPPQVEADPRMEKYKKMLAMRVPPQGVRQQMVIDGIDKELIEDHPLSPSNLILKVNREYQDVLKTMNPLLSDPQLNAAIYSSTPQIIHSFSSKLNLIPPSHLPNNRNDFIATLVSSIVPSNTTDRQQSLIETLKYQQQIIGSNSKNLNAKRRKKMSRKKNKQLTKHIRQLRYETKQVRRTTTTNDEGKTLRFLMLKISTVQTSAESSPIKSKTKRSENYIDYIFMHELWLQYIMKLLDGFLNNDDLILQRLSQADYHGALISVYRSKNPTLVGKKGIVIQETKNMLTIVEKDKNQLCSLIKRQCLFRLEIGEKTIYLSGVAISVRPEQRGNKRSMAIDYMREFC
ncbi:unnamed protein product [Didymodactylos carnosus]|uniref:Ribonuclease P protein subunit p29 n=1 Tax=Didymodactylos carnosus TaxID=1234261 RepID=A0A813VC30_9BILA|nr:unnamed protein product [Didymodactylos carnosus]CAF0835361.1 unnamed protein product [Didymodactylos carnosus]CAF3617648.1 unnamed protein product [Didymodactylos carnosus]CAF3622556.1 unnamed protein product [Didymodactylos carnosus]